MTEIEIIKEKRKTIIHIIIIFLVFIFFIGILIALTIANPLQLNVFDAEKFKDRALSSLPITVIVLGLFPSILITAAIFYSVGHKHGKNGWINRIDEKSKAEILIHQCEKEKAEIKFDYEKKENRRLKKRINILEDERKATSNSFFANFQYEDIEK